MRFLVVADGPQTRAANRLVTVLDHVYDAELWTSATWGSNQPIAQRASGTIFIGEEVRPDVTAQWEGWGIAWGFAGDRAFVSATTAEDPEDTLESVSEALDVLEREVLAALADLDDGDDPGAWRGRHLAGLFRDPKLVVKDATMLDATLRFTPERMLWERQYAFGITAFLRDGFDAFAAGV